MYVIQRVKEHGGTTATHFAVKVDAAGNVTEWTKDRAKAVTVDDATALRVEDRYAARAKAGQPVGKVSAADAVPVAPPVTRPVAGDDE